MSRASRSDTPDHGLRAPRSPMSVSSTSTPPYAPPAGDATPPATASADAEHCCVCLERLFPAAQGAQLSVPFPAAVTQCIWSAWCSIAHKQMVRRTCVHDEHPMPERTTVRQAVQDYQLRTFTSNDAPEPRAPPGVTVLFRHRLAPMGRMGRAGGVDFVRLPHREMQWAPVPIRRAAWCPGWLCPGYGTEVPLDAPTSRNRSRGGGGELHWMYDPAARRGHGQNQLLA
eukprot:s590_g2.t1